MDFSRRAPSARLLAIGACALVCTSSPVLAAPTTDSALSLRLSANGLFLGGWAGRDAGGEALGRLETGLHLQEVELRLAAIVDHWFRAEVTLAGDTEGAGFEEAYVATTDLPHVTIRAGQLLAAFGRHNPLAPRLPDGAL